MNKFLTYTLIECNVCIFAVLTFLAELWIPVLSLLHIRVQPHLVLSNLCQYIYTPNLLLHRPSLLASTPLAPVPSPAGTTPAGRQPGGRALLQPGIQKVILDVLYADNPILIIIYT